MIQKAEESEHILTPESLQRLNSLVASLQQTRSTMRYVDYSQAERDCEQLAAKLLQAYSRQEIGRFSFVAIPRGGLVVLGMLSYALNLPQSQLLPDIKSSSPLVIVDDCALTGARFAHFLRKTASPHIVFAHLYSPAGLRRHICEREPRVKECISAQDLADHAQEHYPDPSDYQAWQKRWQERLGTDRYWVGQSDLICFAWNEPDRLFWNQATERIEHGWKFVPPHLCLKNRAALGLPYRTASSLEWRVPDSVAMGQFDGVLWLCPTDTQQVYILEGVAADMWRALAGYGAFDLAVEHLLSQYDVDRAVLGKDLSSFVDELSSKGLLELSDEPGDVQL